nr:hypothetical protein [Candidatus Sigynarchaeota archaeon]
MNEQNHRLDVTVDRRDIMNAIEDLPRILTEKESISVRSVQNFLAAFNDFMNDVMGVPLGPDILEDLVKKQLDTDRMRIFLITMGFMSSRAILPAIKARIQSIRQKMEIEKYILEEMFMLALTISAVISPDLILTNRERKEEIARKILKIFDIGINGESREESRAILDNLDSIEIQKLTGELEVKIRKIIQEKLDAIAAAAAAAKPSRE